MKESLGLENQAISFMLRHPFMLLHVCYRGLPPFQTDQPVRRLQSH
jgi:hypothetical protein